MRNQLKYSLGLILGLLIALLALHFLPTLTLEGHVLRKVDLLGDLRLPTIDVDSVQNDSLNLLPIVKPVFVDTCQTGMICIEDYSDSTRRGMTPFYNALDRIHQEDGLVRVAFFGDSFIEADIFTADLREMLQKKFGGRGVGFVPMTSVTNGYRPTVRHSFSGWKSHAVTDTVFFDRSKQGISGHYFVPRSGAYAELRGQNKYASLLDTCYKASVFFMNKDSLSLAVRVNKGENKKLNFAPSGTVQMAQIEGRIGAVRWSIDQADSVLFYGMAMDGNKGLVLDNFSLRGSSGLTLRNISSAILKGFNDCRPYDLIVLEYGLNVATERGRNYDNYMKGVLKSIAHLKECFPQAGFLLIGVGDREYRTENGDLRTMPGIKNLIRYQQHIAAKSGIAFWNMFEAMGGEGSIVKMVQAKPAMANYDYTHINFRGGKHLAKLLYETLLYGKSQHDKRRAYEGE
ncbi:MAG: SGNH/GDSL hydrolase family protein [Bacteroides sp.]